MSDHAAEDHGHDDHLEIYEDSGIHETSKPIFSWLYVVYAAFFVFFHWFVGSVFWFQTPDHPRLGAGWQYVEKNNEQWSWGGTPTGVATTLIFGESPTDHWVRQQESTLYHTDYGARR